MDIKLIVIRLEAWANRQRAIRAQWDALVALTGAPPECPMWAPVNDLWMAYTVGVSEAVGDRSEWLQFYEYECEMGARPMDVHSTGGRVIKVRTLRQLARVIAG